MRVPIAKLICKLAFIGLCFLVVSAQKKKNPSTPRPGTHGHSTSTSPRPGSIDEGHKTSTLPPGTQEQKNPSHPDSQVPEDVRMDMILGVQNMKDDNNLASLSGRASFSRRKSLPSGNLFSGRSNDHREFFH